MQWPCYEVSCLCDLASFFFFFWGGGGGGAKEAQKSGHSKMETVLFNKVAIRWGPTVRV